jgi:hypothetical protein
LSLCFIFYPDELTSVFYPDKYICMPYMTFSGFHHLASGSLAECHAAGSAVAGALIFDQETGRIVDIDPRHPPVDQASRPGRPKLGVVAREVTLLPRHWDWLAAQPGGASVALRQLVEAARSDPKHRARAARDSLYRFMTAIVGNAPGYEEALRALYAGERDDFFSHIEAWPPDVRVKIMEMAAGAFLTHAS